MRCSIAARMLAHRSKKPPASPTCCRDFKRTRVGELLRCAWHGWDFDMATGQSYFDPAGTKFRSYPVAVEDGGDLEKGPFVAETFPVSVEGTYVVVEA